MFEGVDEHEESQEDGQDDKKINSRSESGESPTPSRIACTCASTVC